MRALVRDAMAFDRRTLGLTRLLLGFLLLCDLVHRGDAWLDMYSSVGVAPTALNLERPGMGDAFSIFNAFSSPGELRVLWGVMFVTFSCLCVGYRTRLAQILALCFVTGMNSRTGAIVNGGYVVENLLVMWTAFLPLGDRFSVDALSASLRRRREATAAELNDRGDLLPPDRAAPHVSLVGPAILLQLAAIYGFNAAHKTGEAWRDGTAVHYALYVDRRVTPIVALVRDHLPGALVVAMTRVTLVFEQCLPPLLLLPLWRAWARRISIVLINTLHLAFGVTMQLGPFAWSLCVFSTLLFSRDDWELAAAAMARPRRARTVVFDARSGAALLACRLLARLDGFAQLTFEEGEGMPLGLAVRRASGSLVTGSAALADILEALPLGPVVAWIPRLPGVRALLDAALGALGARDVSGFFGLGAGEPRAATPPSGGTLAGLGRAVRAGLREALVVAMLAGAVYQACVENWVISRRFEVPRIGALRLLSSKLLLRQGWFMFCPDPEMEDGTIVVDAVTASGRHVDPFSRRAPEFDLESARRPRLSQMWGDYFDRLHAPAWAGYREAMKDYLLRLPERTGRPEDALVSGDVYWVHDTCPRWGSSRPYGHERVKLFSFHGPAAR